jgi:hypothetical protein
MRAQRRILPAACLAAAALFLGLSATGPAGADKAEDGWRQLFNGKDLSGWDTWLSRPQGSKEVIGLNRDPHKVYSVVTADGRPAIRISGEVFGALTSTDEFENYHLRLEFKWGQKKWPPREKAVRDSGLLYHCYGPQGAAGPWMKSLECQIQEHDCGDFWSVAGRVGTVVDVEGVRKGEKGPVVYRKGGSKFTVPSPGTGPRIVKSADHERPTGEWNTIEVMAVGTTAVHLVNGKANMVLTNIRRCEADGGTPLTRGKIQLQSEGAEVFYRNIAVRPLAEIPAEYLK